MLSRIQLSAAPMDCSPQARILEWVAISSSRVSPPEDQIWVFYIPSIAADNLPDTSPLWSFGRNCQNPPCSQCQGRFLLSGFLEYYFLIKPCFNILFCDRKSILTLSHPLPSGLRNRGSVREKIWTGHIATKLRETGFELKPGCLFLYLQESSVLNMVIEKKRCMSYLACLFQWAWFRIELSSPVEVEKI